MKKIFFFCVLTALLLSLSGCRSRTTLAPRGADKSAVSETTDDVFSGDAQPENVGETVGETVDDPLADRAEYDETARADCWITRPVPSTGTARAAACRTAKTAPKTAPCSSAAMRR